MIRRSWLSPARHLSLKPRVHKRRKPSVAARGTSDSNPRDWYMFGPIHYYDASGSCLVPPALHDSPDNQIKHALRLLRWLYMTYVAITNYLTASYPSLCLFWSASIDPTTDDSQLQYQLQYRCARAPRHEVPYFLNGYELHVSLYLRC